MKSSDAHLTRHGQKRSKERVGLPKRAVQKNAERALKHGLPHSETTGMLRKYLTAIYFQGKTKANNIRVYTGNVYIFTGTTLITVLTLPPHVRKAAEAQQNKFELRQKAANNDERSKQ